MLLFDQEVYHGTQAADPERNAAAQDIQVIVDGYYRGVFVVYCASPELYLRLHISV